MSFVLLFLVALCALVSSVARRLNRFIEIELLKGKWRAASALAIPLQRFTKLNGIDVDARLKLLHEILSQVQSGIYTFADLDIRPARLFAVLSDLSEMLRKEIREYFKFNYFGRQLVKAYRQVLKVAVELLHPLAQDTLKTRRLIAAAGGICQQSA